MKRDMDLIRQILIQVEQSEETAGSGYLEVAIENRSEKEVQYHIRQLLEANLIETQEVAGIGTLDYWPTRLTWTGHEFLDAFRNDTNWQKAKKFVLEKTGALTFEALKQVAIHLAAEAA